MQALEIVVEKGTELPPFHFGHDVQVAPMCYLAWISSYHGDNEQALRWSEQAMERARTVDHANTVGYVLLHTAFTLAWSGLYNLLEQTIEEWEQFEADHEVPAWRPLFRVVECLRMAQSCSAEAIIDHIEDCVRDNEALGMSFVLPQLLAIQANAYTELGELEQANGAIARGIALTESGEKFQLPELLLARVNLLIKSDSDQDQVVNTLKEAQAMSMAFGAGKYEQLTTEKLSEFPGKKSV